MKLSVRDRGASGGGRRRRALAVCGVAALAVLSSTASAYAFGQKINKEDFKRFVNCPTASGNACVYDETLSGGFKMGLKSVPITNPVILQGGLANFSLTTNELLPLIAPRFGVEAMSKSPQSLPGGLTGLTELIGGPVYATAELAGPVSGIKTAPFPLDSREGTGVVLPLKVHLENPILGPECYIGSDEEPIVLHLTDGVSEAPGGESRRIEGKKGTLEGLDKGNLIVFTNNTMVDNTFPVPAAKNCGTGLLAAVVTPLVNVDAGLPSEAGDNTAELTGNLYVGIASFVAKYDKKEVKAKEKAEKPTK